MIKEAYNNGMIAFLEKLGMTAKPIEGAVNTAASTASNLFRRPTFSGVKVPLEGATVGTMLKPALPKTSLKVKGW